MNTHVRDDASLWERYFASRSIDDRNAIVQSYYPLARHISKIRRKGLCSRSELLSHAGEGLIRAVEKFPVGGDPRGFTTFAWKHIQGAISDYIRIRTCRRCRIPRPKVFHCDQMQPRADNCLSSNRLHTTDHAAVRAVDEQDEWHRLLAWMPDNRKERSVLLWTCRDGLTQRECGERLGITESRVSQILRDAKRLWAERFAKSAG